ncbi:MAG TPA: ABC transporter permease [Acidobacteriaceae bacterium]
MIASIRSALARIRAFANKPVRDTDLDQELASHLDFAIEENLRRGLSPEEARRQALIRFGGVEQSREQQRAARGLPALDILLQDLRYTLRTLRRDRGFTFIAILILAIGIGANIAVFSVVNTLMLRPLPFRDAARLLWIGPEVFNGNWSAATYSIDAYTELRERNKSYTDVAGYYAFSSSDNFKLTGHGDPRPFTGIGVTPNFFQVLGVDPLMGRPFHENESLPGAGQVVLLSYPIWQRQFHGDPSVLGQTVDFNGRSFTVVGILPRSFDFGAVFAPGTKVDLFVPIDFKGTRLDGNAITLIGRLKPGVTVAQARGEAKLLFPKLDFRTDHPEYSEGYSGYPTPLKQYVSGKLHRSLIVLWSAVGLILLIVCVNLSNLLLARAAARGKEFALRGALGASRGRIIRQLLTESLLLSGVGSLFGLALAFAITTWLQHQTALALPLLNDVHIDATALLWTLVIAIGTAVLFGLAPGFRMSSIHLQESLKDSGGHGASDGRRHERLRSMLVISEVALACVLLVGAGLLMRSFLRVLDVDLGFKPAAAATIKVDYDDGGNADKRSAILQNVLTRIRAIPGVEHAGISDNLPFERNRCWGAPHRKDVDQKQLDAAHLPCALVYIVTPGYLAAMGVPITGRDFSWEDLPLPPPPPTNKAAKPAVPQGRRGDPVIIINEGAARQMYPNGDALGQVIIPNGDPARIIGIIPDLHQTSVEGQPDWQVYYPTTQQGPEGAELVIRSSVPPEQLAPAILHTLREINPAQPAVPLRPIQSLVDHAVSPRRFFVLLVGTFAGLGLFLAALGIYGVISYSVTRQTLEIGIRMALGATAMRVQFGVIFRTMRLALIGIAVGAVVSLVVASLISAMLFNTAPADPATFIAMVALLTIVAVLAGYIPARRASRVNPIVALRGN